MLHLASNAGAVVLAFVLLLLVRYNVHRWEPLRICITIGYAVWMVLVLVCAFGSELGLSGVAMAWARVGLLWWMAATLFLVTVRLDRLRKN